MNLTTPAPLLTPRIWDFSLNTVTGDYLKREVWSWREVLFTVISILEAIEARTESITFSVHFVQFFRVWCANRIHSNTFQLLGAILDVNWMKFSNKRKYLP